MRHLSLLALLPLLAACSPHDEAASSEGPPKTATVAIAPAAAPRAPGAPITTASGRAAAHASDTRLIVDLPSDVLFGYDSAELAAGADVTLARTARLIETGGPGTVTIAGYTDGKGDDAYNLDLSQRRAKAVKAWLVARGIDAGRIATAGRGKADPVAPNTRLDGSDDPAGRARNRRVQIAIPRTG